MIFPLAAALLLTLATLLPLLLWRWWRGGSLRFLLGWHVGLLVLHSFVTFPLGLGLLASRSMPHTKPAEARQQLRSATLLARDQLSELTIASTGGMQLRTYRLRAVREPPRAVVVLAHGLFRSAIEVEPVALLLRELGCECWLVDLRNHGGSTRAPFTGGLRESDDVVAVVEHLRGLPERAQTPLGLFGVSLGSCAVALALPRIQQLGGVVLDAPIERLAGAADRMLQFERANDRRSWFQVHQPWRSLVLRSLELWSGFAIADVAPIEVLAHCPHDLAVLVVGGALDDRSPPAVVRELFAQLPMPESHKQLWLREGSGHGKVWVDDPAGYQQHLRWWVNALAQ